MAYRCIHIGTGGFGGAWCVAFLPPSIQQGLVEVVAAVDINPDHFMNAKNGLGLTDEQLYTDARQAMEECEADFCTIVVPPAFHEEMVDLALEHGLNILSEKPIADTMEGACRIAKKARDAGVKMGVTMSHRFDQDKTTLRQQLRSGKWGGLDYLVSRFTCECRRFATWGKFRYEIPYPLLIEGSVHHLDLLVDMGGALCEELYCQGWQPAWGEFAGDSQALITMRLANGVRIFYEGAKTNAVGLNCWTQEYVRAECEGGTLVMDHREIEAFPYTPEVVARNAVEGEGEEVQLLEQPLWQNAWLIQQYIAWLDGGPPMETNVEANLQSMALIFAAIESTKTGQPVRVQEFLAQHLAAVGY